MRHRAVNRGLSRHNLPPAASTTRQESGPRSSLRAPLLVTTGCIVTRHVDYGSQAASITVMVTNGPAID